MYQKRKESRHLSKCVLSCSLIWASRSSELRKQKKALDWGGTRMRLEGFTNECGWAEILKLAHISTPLFWNRAVVIVEDGEGKMEIALASEETETRRRTVLSLHITWPAKISHWPGEWSRTIIETSIVSCLSFGVCVHAGCYQSGENDQCGSWWGNILNRILMVKKSKLGKGLNRVKDDVLFEHLSGAFSSGEKRRNLCGRAGSIRYSYFQDDILLEHLSVAVWSRVQKGSCVNV